ncbi:uncharacterized protein LOC142629099 [Castanea sativa]|uniref:uncharacterized protein LOC142629099 n=1 Tax=Castanea sativa TaxID=21020 RepID=UPI003F64FDE8
MSSATPKVAKVEEPACEELEKVLIDDNLEKFFQVGIQLPLQEKAELTLRRYKLCLNTSKCSFGVGSGKFLGYMVTHRRIEVNPAQVKAINSLQPPRNPKEVQRLTGMTTALNRFISRSSDRCKPFFQLLNKWKGFEWTKECALAFQQLKEYLLRPPIMSRPEIDKVLFAYIVVADHAVSLVLIWVDNNVQRPVYYVRKSLHEVEVYVDGATNQRGSGVGLVLVSPKGLSLEKSLRLGFSATNNEAEYETLLVGMDMVQKMGGKTVQIFSDSQLVVGQVEGTLEARDPRIQEYLIRARYLQSKFDSFTLLHVSRSMNTHADSLATLAISSAQGLPQFILIEDICKPTGMNNDTLRIHQIRVGPSWMDPIVSFLKNDILPEEKSEANKIRRKAHRFWLSEDEKLYKCSFSGPFCCVNTLKQRIYFWKSYMKGSMEVT